jgi:hypothetical protein
MMKDIIDLGNLVFDRLIEAYGETQESRMLFLYGITTSTSWSVLNSEKTILVQSEGVSLNFEDPVISKLSSQWQSIRAEKDKAALAERLRRFKEEYEKPAPKDGDTFNFWSDPGTFREIRL